MLSSITSVDITPDFDALYKRFKGELEAETKRLAHDGTAAELGAVRRLLIPLAIMATCVANPDMLKDFQEAITGASSQIARAHDVKLEAQTEECSNEPADGQFCAICDGHAAFRYTGVDGKPHVQCPRCGIVA